MYETYAIEKPVSTRRPDRIMRDLADLYTEH